MEKTITISDISAKFTKNFDLFGKMQPFITFKAGTTIQKTQISNAGLQPKWNAVITLQTYEINEIEITAYDEDLTENQYMGTAKLNIKTLKSSGNHTISIIGQDQKSIGDLFFKYEIKDLNKNEQANNSLTNESVSKVKSSKKIQQSAPISSFKNSIEISQISATFTKNFDTFGKMQPFMHFKIGNSINKTEVCSEKGEQFKWKKVIKLGFNEEHQIQIKCYDEDLTQDQYMGRAIVSLKQLSKTSKHKAQIVGQDNIAVGYVFFTYHLKRADQSEAKTQVKAQSKKVIGEPSPSTNQKPPIQKPANQKTEPIKTLGQNPRVEKASIKPEKKQQHRPIEQKAPERQPNKLTQLSERQFHRKQTALNQSKSKNQSFMDKSLQSRETLKLPNIGDVSKNFGDKIYDKQSSATLQKSILVYSMPKAPRFYTGPKYCGQPSYYVDSCFKPNSTKGVGFGFGSKKQFPEWMEKNMKENPAPGAYFEQSKIISLRSKGPTFGISYKFYQKVTIPRQKSPQRVTKSNQRLKPIFRNN